MFYWVINKPMISTNATSQNSELRSSRKIRKKTPVPKFLSNKDADLQPATLLKRDPDTSVFQRIL